MKTLHLSIVAILIVAGVVLLYSTANFELAEKRFEDQRNGLACKLGSHCPFPDFDGPIFFGIIGLGIFFAGITLTVLKDRSKLIMIVLGITSLSAGIPSLLAGILAYVDDYNHMVLIMKNCSNTPCMYPSVFANIQSVQFHGIYGAILVAIGVISLAYLRRGNKK